MNKDKSTALILKSSAFLFCKLFTNRGKYKAIGL